MPRGVKFSVECENCERANRVVPDGSESDVISCTGCGHQLATVAELNDEIARQLGSIMTDGLKARLREMLRSD